MKIFLIFFFISNLVVFSNNTISSSYSYPIKNDKINIISILDAYDINYKYDAILHKLSIEHYNYRANFIDGQKFYFLDGNLSTTDNIPSSEIDGFYIDTDTTKIIVSKILDDDINIFEKSIGSVDLLYIENLSKKDEKKISRVLPQINESTSTTIDVIIIDAGHGGKDSGAVAINEKYEKDITLEYSKALFQELKKRLPKKTIKLTRDDDYFISLEDRPYMANEYIDIGTDNPKNGLFISIHANASINKNARGFEIFFLSADETSEYSRSIAKFENNPSIKLKNTNITNYTESLYSYMLIEQYQKESRYMAELIGKEILKIDSVYERATTVKSALFYVLKGALMPAVLIEIGFITNQKDIDLISTQKFKNDFIKKTADGIVDFVNDFEKTKGFTE